MKKIVLILFVAGLTLSSCATFNKEALIQGGLQAAQAATVTDSEIRAYVSQYIAKLDATNTVLPESNTYTKRLRKITSGINSIGGVPLNFKVYKTSEVNAFACADGSVRVYTGLMDLMTDDEILGVIGHEIGHVAKNHTRKQLQNAILTSAARTGLSAAGGTIAALSQSELGAIGEAALNAKYSRSQEIEADDYAYTYLKSTGKSPVALMKGLQKLQSLDGGNSSSSSLVSNLFSSHPDTQSRVNRVAKRLRADGLIQ